MKKYLLKTIFLFVISISGATVFAQVEIDLKTALKYTIEHHGSVQKAQIDIQIGGQLLRESISTGLPQISANATILNNLALRTSLVPAEFFGGQPGQFAQIQFGTNWNANAGVQLNQMIFNKTWLLAVEGSKKLKDFYEISLEKSKEDVVYETAKLYYQIQLNQTQKGILDANLQQILGLITVTEKQYKNGFAKKIDIDRLSVQKSNLETQISNLELQSAQLEQALKYAMQMPLDKAIILTDTISETPLKDVKQTLVKPSYQTRPAIGILNIQQDLYSLDYRRWKSGYFPTVNLFANYTYEWQANKFGDFTDGKRWTDFSQVGLFFNFPIFDGMFKDSKMQTAELNELKTIHDLQLTQTGYQLQHQAAVTAYKVNQNNLSAVKENMRVAESVFSISQKRYKEGLAPITELLDAESSMRDAQTNYIITIAQIKLAEIDLLHANGKLVGLVD